MYSMENAVGKQNNNPLGIAILEQGFSQLPVEGKILLKGYLKITVIRAVEGVLV